MGLQKLLELLERRSGSPARARTRDPLINSQLLYQLSYRGIEARILNELQKYGNRSFTELFESIKHPP